MRPDSAITRASRNLRGRRGRAARRAAAALCLALGLAPSTAAALDWQSLWLNDDQRAAGKMAREHYAAAAEVFDDESWRAAAWYRAGEYEKAAQAWARLDAVDAHYNRGNALARAGRLHEAAAAYETVLEREPGHADARHNLEVIREMMEESSDPSGPGDSQEPRGNEPPEPGRPQQGDQGEQKRQPQRSRSDQDGNEGAESSPSESSRSDSGEGRQPARQDEGTDSQAQRARQGQSEPRERPHQAGEEAAQAPHPEQRAATEQWLRRIPDDPGGLLRRKFRYQYGQRRRGDETVEQPW